MWDKRKTRERRKMQIYGRNPIFLTHLKRKPTSLEVVNLRRAHCVHFVTFGDCIERLFVHSEMIPSLTNHSSFRDNSLIQRLAQASDRTSWSMFTESKELSGYFVITLTLHSENFRKTQDKAVNTGRVVLGGHVGCSGRLKVVAGIIGRGPCIGYS